MITQRPEGPHFDAATINGMARLPMPQPVLTAILRAGFRTLPSAGGVHEVVLDPQAAELTTAGPSNPTGAHSDMVTEKHRADIIVEGHVSGTAGGQVRVNNQIWLSRANGTTDTGDVAKPADVTHNLFGRHGMDEANRLPASGTATLSVTTSNGTVRTAPYHPRLNNSYRRSPGFGAGGLGPSLPPSALVEIYQTADASDTPYQVRLPATTYSARLRIASGHCPDVPRRWAIRQTVEMALDTFVIAPDAGRGHLVWRASWPVASYDPDRLRAIQIQQSED